MFWIMKKANTESLRTLVPVQHARLCGHLLRSAKGFRAFDELFWRMHRMSSGGTPLAVGQFGHDGVKEESVPDLVGLAHQSLHVILHFLNQLLLPRSRVEARESFYWKLLG